MGMDKYTDTNYYYALKQANGDTMSAVELLLSGVI